jgi:hypothetical protein
VPVAVQLGRALAGHGKVVSTRLEINDELGI